MNPIHGQSTVNPIRNTPGFTLGFWQENPLETDGGGDYQSNLGTTNMAVNGAGFSWNGKLSHWLFLEPSIFMGKATYRYPETHFERDLHSLGYGWSFIVMPRARIGKLYFGLGPKIGNTYVRNMHDYYRNRNFTEQFSTIGFSARIGIYVLKNWMIEARADRAILGGGNGMYATGGNGLGISIVRMRKSGSIF